jgi:hypothetical protein
MCFLFTYLSLNSQLYSCLHVLSRPKFFPPLDFLPLFRINHAESDLTQAMLNVIYAIKSCMLIMYTRLILGLTANRLVYYLSAYVAIGYIASQIAFFTICMPFSGYWAMPPPNPQCSTLTHYSIVQGCFNISADILMLFISLPLITKLTMPLKQKAVLIVIFSLGTFVIIAAILNNVFNLANIWSPIYMLWYTCESSVAV